MIQEKFLKKEAEIEAKNGIYLKSRLYYPDEFYEHSPNLTVKEFILLFINDLRTYPTYSTNKLGRSYLQCSAYRKRSAEDIYRLCKYYFPRKNITLRKIMKILYDLVLENKISTWKCSIIHKRVFFQYSSYCREIHLIDEFNLKFYDWNFK